MSAAIVRRIDFGFTVQIEIPYHESMLEAGEAILDGLNRAGVAATAEALSRFDADGKPMAIDGVKFTSKGRHAKDYQTPYGVASVPRHVYQPSRGGKTYCPLDEAARIVVSSTPRFARIIAHKYAEFGSARVTHDLLSNHGRDVARSFVQNVAEAVAAVAPAREEDAEYELPAPDRPVATVTVGLDGTCMLMGKDTWREAMVGTLGFYDADGERLHTVYTAATPEHGKLTFYERLDGEVARAKAAFPGARFVGLADGAKDNWLYLETVTKELVVDFYHASEYAWMAADAMFNAAKTPAEIRPWVESWMHRLKHEEGADRLLIADLERRGEALGRPRLPEGVERALTYFKNQSKAGRMGYAA